MYTLERMQRQNDGRAILNNDVKFILRACMTLSSLCRCASCKKPRHLSTILALQPFYGIFHPRDIGGELDVLTIPEPDMAVRIAFYGLDAFGVERGIEVGKDLFEHMRKREERGGLIESVSVMVD